MVDETVFFESTPSLAFITNPARWPRLSTQYGLWAEDIRSINRES